MRSGGGAAAVWSASAAVVKEAERWGADLIVTGAHGHGPEGSLSGSVAEDVARTAPVSGFPGARDLPGPTHWHPVCWRYSRCARLGEETD